VLGSVALRGTNIIRAVAPDSLGFKRVKMLLKFYDMRRKLKTILSEYYSNDNLTLDEAVNKILIAYSDRSALKELISFLDLIGNTNAIKDFPDNVKYTARELRKEINIGEQGD